jgi:uncharacterized membrane protein YfcA
MSTLWASKRASTERRASSRTSPYRLASEFPEAQVEAAQATNFLVAKLRAAGSLRASLELVAVIVSAAVAFVAYIVRMGGNAVGGYYDGQLLLFTALLLPLMWLGNRTGERITSKMSPQVFSRVLAAVLFAAGVSLLLK